MNKVYMHYEENKTWYLKTLYVCVLCLMLWGFYKNGLIYFWQGNLSFLEALRPLFFPLLGIICCILGEYRTSKKISSDSIMEGLLLGILIPPRYSLGLFFILAVFYGFFRNIIKRKLPTISSLLLFKVITIFLNMFLLSVDYQNIIEFNKPYLYGIIDTLFGRSIGNVGTTSIFILLIFYFIKTCDYYYKKELPIYIIASYSVLTIIYSILMPQENMLLSLLNSHIYFMAIVLATIPKTSPAEKKYMVLFGVFIGILSFFFQTILHFSDGIYLSLFFLQVAWMIFFFLRRSKYKDKV